MAQRKRNPVARAGQRAGLHTASKHRRRPRCGEAPGAAAELDLRAVDRAADPAGRGDAAVARPRWCTMTPAARSSHSASRVIVVPSVIRLRSYVRVPYRARVPMTRAALMHRDRFRCAYCGSKADTVDHVVPAAAGEHSWENCVAACRRATTARPTSCWPNWAGRWPGADPAQRSALAVVGARSGTRPGVGALPRRGRGLRLRYGLARANCSDSWTSGPHRDRADRADLSPWRLESADLPAAPAVDLRPHPVGGHRRGDPRRTSPSAARTAWSRRGVQRGRWRKWALVSSA